MDAGLEAFPPLPSGGKAVSSSNGGDSGLEKEGCTAKEKEMFVKSIDDGGESAIGGGVTWLDSLKHLARLEGFDLSFVEPGEVDERLVAKCHSSVVEEEVLQWRNALIGQ